MEQEIWKPVVGYEDFYEVSNFGRVKSLPRKWAKGGMLKPSPVGHGYLRVCLCKNGKRERVKVHQLVMEAFVGRCPAGYEVDHIDWNPSNNRLDNLRYLPAEENNSRKSPEWYKNTAEAIRRTKSKPVDQFTLDGQFVKRWSSTRETARELGLKQPGISRCCNGKRKTAGGFIWRFAD